MTDANALEVEIRNSSGQEISADDLEGEELKLIALNSLMHSNPDQALPTCSLCEPPAFYGAPTSSYATTLWSTGPTVAMQNRDQRGSMRTTS